VNPTAKRIGIGLAIVCLGVYAASSVLSARSAASRLDRDRDDLVELRQKLSEIESVSADPRVAALELEAADRIVNRIDAALLKAGLKDTLLANQTPFEPQRIGQSNFKIRRVEIELNAATVLEIAAFCDALKDESTGSVVRDLQLFAPTRTGSRETWNSQMILTQIIFSPKSEG
jgi:hypothetical protein